MGCFWGAERKFWELDGVITTAVGYAGGHTPNPTYEETCSGRTGHTEVVLVVYDPDRVTFEQLLTTFWENHDPTQGMRQGNDRGTPVPLRDLHHRRRPARGRHGQPGRLPGAPQGGRLRRDHHRDPPGRRRPAAPFFYAEGYHQQYLAKNPMGYCGIGGTGVSCPIGLAG